MGELPLGRQLLLGHFEAGVDRLEAVGSPRLEAPSEGGRVRRRDEDLYRLAHRGSHLPGTLYLDLQDHRVALSEPPRNLRAQGAVPIAAVGGELEKIFGFDSA